MTSLNSLAMLAALMAFSSLLYATAGQAGGTAFLAVMALAGCPAAEMRFTALMLNVLAAGYATWRLQRRGEIDWSLLRPLTAMSLAMSLVGGFVVLDGRIYHLMTGSVLVAAAALMLAPRAPGSAITRRLPTWASVTIGGAAGLLSGLSGVGGGVFLTPVIVFGGWASARTASRISPPFIMFNSAAGLVGATIAEGPRFVQGVPLLAVCVLAGSAIGTVVGTRWMSERATRTVLAVVLAIAGARLLWR